MSDSVQYRIINANEDYPLILVMFNKIEEEQKTKIRVFDLEWPVVVDPLYTLTSSSDFNIYGSQVYGILEVKNNFLEMIVALDEVHFNFMHSRAMCFKQSCKPYIIRLYELSVSFSELSQEQRNKLIESQHSEAIEHKDNLFEPTSVEALQNKFVLMNPTFSNNKTQYIQNCFNEMDISDDRESNKYLKKIIYVLGIEENCNNSKLRSLSEIDQILDSEIYGMNDVKTRIKEALVASKYSGKTDIKILLYGSPGVGKSSVAKSIARCLNLPLEVIDMAQADILALTGSNSTWSSSQPGRIVEAYYKHHTTSIIIQFDEIEKAGKAAAYDASPYSALIPLLGPDHYFKDEYLDYAMDVSNSVFLATANDLNSIPPLIRNRFDEIIRIPDYDSEIKVQIGKLHLLPNILKEYNLNKEILISDDVLLYIAEFYTFDFGAREYNSRLKDLIRAILIQKELHNITFPFTVDKDFVKSHLIKNNNYNKKPAIGF